MVGWARWGKCFLPRVARTPVHTYTSQLHALTCLLLIALPTAWPAHPASQVRLQRGGLGRKVQGPFIPVILHFAGKAARLREEDPFTTSSSKGKCLGPGEGRRLGQPKREGREPQMPWSYMHLCMRLCPPQTCFTCWVPSQPRGRVGEDPLPPVTAQGRGMLVALPRVGKCLVMALGISQTY